MLYQQIHATMARRAAAKLGNRCCQTHSSFKLRKTRSIMPFCSGVCGRDELLPEPIVATGRPEAPFW